MSLGSQPGGEALLEWGFEGAGRVDVGVELARGPVVELARGAVVELAGGPVVELASGPVGG